MKQFIKSLWFLSLCSILSLSACGKDERASAKLAKSMAKTAEQEKKQEPKRHYQKMLEALNVVVYERALTGGSSDIYTFEIDGVKCIAVYRVGLSCDYNDEHIAQNLAAKQKRLQAKSEQEFQQIVKKMEESRLEAQRQQNKK